MDEFFSNVDKDVDGLVSFVEYKMYMNSHRNGAEKM